MSLPILSLLIALPLAEMVFVLCLDFGERFRQFNIEMTALWGALINLIAVIFLMMYFDGQAEAVIFEEKIAWFSISGRNLAYHVGADHISILFSLLSSFIIAIIIGIVPFFVETQLKFFLGFVFLVQSCLFGLFFSQDMFLFLIFFEFLTIPLFFLMSLWERARQKKTSYVMLIYLLVGSLVSLLSFFYLFVVTGASDFSQLAAAVATLSPAAQRTLMILLFFSLGIKIPLWPLHRWMPAAYAESLTPLTLLLFLTKVGFFALLRLVIPVFPAVIMEMQTFFLIFLLVGIVLSSLAAYGEEDMKKSVSFLSIAHMSLLVMALMSGTQEGIYGAIYGFVVQTISKTGLFLFFGYVEMRTRTRNVREMGGLIRFMPLAAFFSMLFTLGVIALPGTGVFVAEFRSFLGIFRVSYLIGAAALFFVTVFTTIVMLSLMRQIFFGRASEEPRGAIRDIHKIGWFTGACLGFFLIWSGFSSSRIDRFIQYPARVWLASIEAAAPKKATPPSPKEGNTAPKTADVAVQKEGG